MKKLLPLLFLSTTLLLSGCFWQKEEPEPEPPPTDIDISIADLKAKYNDTADKDILPLYNVEPDEIFELEFNSYVGDLPFSDIVSVHTDIEVLGNSSINIEVTPESYVIGPSTLRVKPLESTLTASNQEGNWGRAPIFYMRVNYDLDSPEPTRLERPIIIPFTIKSEVEAPQVSFYVSDSGRAKLVWDEIEGATEYRVYNLTNQTMLQDTGDLNSTQLAFNGFSIYNVGSTKSTEFLDWESDETNGIIQDYQNQGLKGDYYVTAIVDGKESLASNIVSTNELKGFLPKHLVQNIDKTEHETIRSLPNTVTVELLNGRHSEQGVRYLTEGVEIKEDEDAGLTSVPYVIPNTVFKGEVLIAKITETDLEVIDAINKPNGIEKSYTIHNNTAHFPSNDLLTVTNASTEPEVEEEIEEGEEDVTTDDEQSNQENAEESGIEEPPETEEVEEQTSEEQLEEGSEEESIDGELIPEKLVAKQKYYTELQLEQSNQETVVSPVILELEDYQLNTSSALEDYLAYSILNVKDEISLKAFPYAQTYELITDTVEKVLYQNPLLIGVTSWYYDYETQSIKVEYSDSSTDIQSKQTELLTSMSKLINKVVYGVDEEVIAEEQAKVDQARAEKKWYEFWKIIKDVEVEPNEPNDIEKQHLIYTYLNDTVQYGLVEGVEDETSPEEVEETTEKETTETESEESETEKQEDVQLSIDIDPYTAYGVIINNVGLDRGYAQAYQLMSELVGLETITVSGVYNLEPHVWNKTNVDGSWVNIDTSMNFTNLDVPYMVYNVNDANVRAINLVETKGYMLNREVVAYNSENVSLDYYFQNDLIVDTVEKYTEKLNHRLQEGQTEIIIRTEVKLDPQQVYDATASSLQIYASDKLATSQFKEIANYIILLTDPPVEGEEEEALEDEERAEDEEGLESIENTEVETEDEE